MKAIIYIPSFEDTQTLFPVLQNIRTHFPELLIRICCSTKNKERLQWLHSHSQMFQYAILEAKGQSLKDEMAGLKETILECREKKVHLWILNGRVLVNERIGYELERAIKKRKRIGIVGVPTMNDDGRFCTPYRYFRPFANGPISLQERRIPFSCTLLSLDFLEKINPENTDKSTRPPSFYFSALSKRLGYSNGLLNRVRVLQLRTPKSQNQTLGARLLQFLSGKEPPPIEL